MRGLTLWRPWPASIIHAGKRVENREWLPPRHLLGQDFALHAGKTIDGFEPAIDPALLPGPLGIVAVVRLAGYISELDGRRVRVGIDEAHAREIVESRWWCGPVGWVLDDVRPLTAPVPHRGAQGIWVVEPAAERDILAQIRRAA